MDTHKPTILSIYNIILGRNLHDAQRSGLCAGRLKIMTFPAEAQLLIHLTEAPRPARARLAQNHMLYAARYLS